MGRIKAILTLKWIRWGLYTGLGFIVAIIAGNVWVNVSTRNYLYNDIDKIPARQVGMVLGTSQYLKGGRVNLFFEYRIQAAASLYHKGKVKQLLVSGDNATARYDEPAMMRRELIKRGVPACAITCDYAGFRTFDSVIRTWKVFGQTSYIIISQKFHNQRAVFIGRRHGLDVIGFNARDVKGANGLKTHIREYFARIKAVIDLYIWPASPRFLGDPVAVSTCDTLNL